VPKVFVSHSAKDREFVEQEIVQLLQSHGIETWYSTDDIGAGVKWERSIREGLRSCDWFLVVLSNESVKSEWVEAEIHWALDERKDRIVPVRIDDCDEADLHLKLRQIQAVDFRSDRDLARQKLLAAWSTDREAAAIPSSGAYVRVSDFLVAKQVLESVSWLDAVEHAETLKVGGYSGWQLPTVDQLWAIMDFEEELFEKTRYHTREECGSQEAYYMNIGSARLNVAPKTYSRAINAIFVKETPEEAASP
jgi:hypothetical protein